MSAASAYVSLTFSKSLSHKGCTVSWGTESQAVVANASGNSVSLDIRAVLLDFYGLGMKELDIRLEVGQERGIAAISDDIRSQVGSYLTQAAGIDNVELAVSVQSIVSGVSVKKRRIK